MISRRNVLIGGSCFVAAGSAAALTPRNRMSLVHGAKFEDTIPLQFAGWTRRETSAIVTPEDENSLSARLYSQTLGRLYTRGDSDYVMMLIAYGDTQSDMLQLHRPEVCYPAFGFDVTQSNRTDIALGNGVSIPGRSLTATLPDRTEHITYWTRIGEYLPIDGHEQRMMKLRTAFAGIIPDGVLVRISSAENNPTASFALNQEFAADLLAATPPNMRPALIGTQATHALTQKRA